MVKEELQVFGNDYPTKDGTCRRDYLHVVDLAKGHLSALNWLLYDGSDSGAEAFNLGTGNPISVLEIINKFEEINGIRIPYRFVERRAGDLPEFWADATKANNILNWRAELSIEEMLEDAWLWQSNNPDGYGN